MNICRCSPSLSSFGDVTVDYTSKSFRSNDQPSQINSIRLSPSVPEITSSIFEYTLPFGEQDQGPKALQKQEGLLSSLKTFIAKQDDVVTTRMLTRERRVELRNKRNTVKDLEVQFMQKLNLLLIYLRENTAKPDPSLLDKFEEYQDAQNDYSSLEDDYNQLEDQMDIEEYELETAANDLKEAVDADERIPDTLATTGYPIQRDDLLPEPEAIHPLVKQYLSRSGDVDLLVEELWELREDYNMALEDQAMRNKYGMSVEDPDALDLLANFGKYEKDICDELAIAEKDKQQLKSQCDEQGLLSNSQDPRDKLRSNPFEAIEDVPELKWSEQSPPFFEENLVMKTFVKDKVRMPDFINKWLLHQLFQSPLDRLRSSRDLSEICNETKGFSDLDTGCWDVENSTRAMSMANSGILVSYPSTPTPTNVMERATSTESIDARDLRPHTPANAASSPPMETADPTGEPQTVQIRRADSVLVIEEHLGATDLPVDKPKDDVIPVTETS